MKNMLFVGDLTIDYISRVESFPEKNTQENVIKTVKYFGGAAANAAVAASMLNMKSGLMTCVGRDFEETGYRNYLNKMNIALEIEKRNDEETAKSFIFNDSKGNQLLYFYGGASKYLNQIKPSRKTIKKYDIIHMVAGNSELNLNILKVADDKFISYDPGQKIFDNKDNVLEIISHSNMISGNMYEMEEIKKYMKTSDLKNILKLGPEIILITYGKDGAKIITEKEKHNIKPIRCKAVDPSGAGDSFKAGFLSAIERGYNIREAAKIGSSTASFVVEQEGTQTNLPNWDSVLNRYKKFYA